MNNTIEIIWQILSSPAGIFAAIFFFGASIFVHEFGHYLAARWRGLEIERFSIGMGPRLWGWTDKHGVVWQLSLFPIGGYVLLPQLADMAAIEGGAKQKATGLPPLTWSDKVIVAAAGAFFNIIFAFCLGTILWIAGLPQPAGSEQTVVGPVYDAYYDYANQPVDGPAYVAGIRTGDRILAIDGKAVSDFEDVRNAILVSTGSTDDGTPKITVTFERDGATRTVDVFPVIASQEKIRTIGIVHAYPAVVGSVFPDSPALAAGIQAGDRIVALNGKKLVDRGEISNAINDPDTQSLTLGIDRDGTRLDLELSPRYAKMSDDGTPRKMIGVRWQETFVNQRIPPWQVIADVGELTYTTISALVNPKTDVGLRNLSGPIGILNIMRLTADQGFLFLLWIVIIINVNLAILNLLPLPILDGGHILIATYHKLTGHPIPARLIATAQGAMVLFLLGTMIYVTFFDVGRTAAVEKDRMAEEKAIAQFYDTPNFLPADFVPTPPSE